MKKPKSGGTRHETPASRLGGLPGLYADAAVSGGLCINAFSVTQPYILAQNGFTNTETSMITTACSVTFLLCMFVVNRYYAALGYRLGMTLAALLGAVSFVLFALAKTLAGYYLAGAVSGISYGLGCMIPVTILMLRWFRACRVGVRSGVDARQVRLRRGVRPARKQSPNLNARAIFLKL